MNIMKRILPHFVIVLSGIFLVFLILDGYNPTMNFIDNTVSQKLFWIFCIVSIVNSGIMIASNRIEWRIQQSKQNNQ